MKKNRIFRNLFKVRELKDSFELAIRGIAYLFLYHRNMRMIFLLGIAAFLSGVYLKLKGIELVALCLTITLVFMAEIFNTAIEMLMGVVAERYRTRIKLIKDIAAGVVLLASLNALAVGYVLFIRRLFN